MKINQPLYTIFSLLTLFSLACGLLTGAPFRAEPVSIEPTTPATPAATLIRQSLAGTPPLTEPAPTEISVTPAWPELNRHYQAMLPQFTADVDLVATAGASQYRLDISLDPDSFNDPQGLRLTGTEQVRYTNTETVPLAEIYFRLYPNLPGYGGQMTVETVMVNGQPVEPALTAGASVLGVPLSTPLAPGETLELTLIYQTLVPTANEQGYNIYIYTEQTVALAGFYPAIAVYDDEGWNIEVPPVYGDATFLDTSLYDVSLTVPQSMVVAASGSQLTATTNDNGTQTLEFVSGPMRDFYVVMRPDYQIASELVDGTLVNSYFSAEFEAGGLLALRYAADALRVFNERFGPYPYAEFDVVATPTTAGGVEYPGIVVINQDLYNQAGGFFQHATVHEVAHQWWYALVGNDQIDEPWLDESLTNYSTAIYWAEIEDSEAAVKVIESMFVQPYEAAKKQGRDRAVIGAVAEFSEGEYGLFVYGKGPLFFHALRQEVGEVAYFEIMRTYYTEYKYGIAYPADLFEVIERVSGLEVEPLYETWLKG